MESNVILKIAIVSLFICVEISSSSTIYYKISAKNLPRMDPEADWDTTDAFVNIYLNGNRTGQVKAIHNTVNPKWDDLLEVQYSSTDDYLQFDLFDDDDFYKKPHEYIGFAYINVYEMNKVGTISVPIIGHGQTRGTLIVKTVVVQNEKGKEAAGVS